MVEPNPAWAGVGPTPAQHQQQGGFVVLGGSGSMCIFGAQCFSGSQAEGHEICSYCRNVAVPLLHQRAQAHPNSTIVKAKVKAYADSWYNESLARTAKGGPYLCITKDVGLAGELGFTDFNLQSRHVCFDVDARYKLCNFCYPRIQATYGKYNTKFDENLLGFPCVFIDPHYNGTAGAPVVPMGWQEPKEKDKKTPVENWFPTNPCTLRVITRGHICHTCYARIESKKQYKKFFNSKGQLRPDWNVGSVGKT